MTAVSRKIFILQVVGSRDRIGYDNRWYRRVVLIADPEHSRVLKRALLIAIKVIAGIAAFVFVVANPLTSRGGIAFFLSIPVLLLCFFVWLLSGGDRHSGYWPHKSSDR